jgi:hypothetical protein
MRIRVVISVTAAIAAASIAFATTGVAAAAIKNPMSLLLRKTDLPRGATYQAGPGPRNLVASLAKLGIKSQDAYFSATYGDETGLSGLVLAVESAGKAHTVFPKLKGDLGGAAKTRVVRLPAYGDEQFATTSSGSADLVVRKKRVIWSLSLVPSFLSPMSRTEMTAELKKYAVKAKARIGSG